jgi:hypothetical protein
MMNKIPKEQRNKLVLVWLMIVGLVCTWAFVVLSWQMDSKHGADRNLERNQKQYSDMTRAVSGAGEVETQMEEAEQHLAAVESRMANGGDTYAWVINTMREFKAGYKGVDIPQFSQIKTADVTLIPHFPYREASVTVAGTAYFHDLGLFIADFENRFHFARIINLEIESGLSQNPADREKLSFKMDIVFLLKSSAS